MKKVLKGLGAVLLILLFAVVKGKCVVLVVVGDSLYLANIGLL